jgi:hypothetical protein
VGALSDQKLELFAQALLRNIAHGLARGKATTEAAREAGYRGSAMADNARKRANRKMDSTIFARLVTVRKCCGYKLRSAVRRYFLALIGRDEGPFRIGLHGPSPETQRAVQMSEKPNEDKRAVPGYVRAETLLPIRGCQILSIPGMPTRRVLGILTGDGSLALGVDAESAQSLSELLAKAAKEMRGLS